MITHVIILYDLAVLVRLDLFKLLRQPIKPLFTNTGIDESNLLHLHTLYIFRCDYVCFAVFILWDETISCLLDFYSGCLSPVLKPQGQRLLEPHQLEKGPSLKDPEKDFGFLRSIVDWVG